MYNILMYSRFCFLTVFFMLLCSVSSNAATNANLSKVMEAAKNGDASAYTALGEIYQYGDLGEEKNFQKAINYYKIAYEKGDPYALTRLGIMYQRGEGVTKDLRTAFELYTESARLGSGRALNSLGIMYLNGFYVKKDTKKALELFSQSVLRGNVRALLSAYLVHNNSNNHQTAYICLSLFLMYAKNINPTLMKSLQEELSNIKLKLTKSQLSQAESDTVAMSFDIDKAISERKFH